MSHPLDRPYDMSAAADLCHYSIPDRRAHLGSEQLMEEVQRGVGKRCGDLAP
ncbi:hypothetical protein PGT21_013519 [Puccinia graminis f. sp. tritici]|uniref:Uncharacterized protein n=1 Tax=Puccinia graminis f. sp. tritici TaxID=56615 RepID=A0A5B0QT82_PUCGR|nr:hypothetical protein PGT21_013519 [Puccinia graminis f. sp. tritici]